MQLTRRQFLCVLALLPWVTWPDLALAQEPVEYKVYLPWVGGGSMSLPFPCSPILDPDGPNAGPPPSASWINAVGYDGMVTTGGQFAIDPASVGLHAENVALWGTQTGANCEVYLKIPTRCADEQFVYVLARTSNPPLADGYVAALYRDDAGGDLLLIGNETGVLGSWPVIFEDGDGVGLRCCGSTISGWQYKASTGWVEIGSVVSVSTTAGGYIGMAIGAAQPPNASDLATRLDDFGGGTATDNCCGTSPAVEAPMVTTKCTEDPTLALVCANGDRLDLITWESGFELDDPGWRPQVAQFKGGGSYANSQIAEGQTLVAGEYDNVVETIPLVARGTSEAKCIQTYRRLQQFIKRASDYWKEPSEYDDVWLEVRPAGLGCRTGYARVVKASCADFANPFGQPFFSQQALSVADGLSLVVEREPLWRAVPPGELIGPLYNLLRNPDFEEWNSGVADSQPDCWSDVEIGAITGTNARDTTGPKWGRAALVVDVTNSTGAGQAKGVTQVAEGTEDGQEYTVVAWVRNAGVTGGVGRILVTSLLGQYEVYRSATQHGWTLYTYVFMAGVGDVIGVNCEILSTAAGMVGTVYFDSLMLLKGDWEEEAIDGMLPYMTSSHIVNHWDTGAGHLNYVDAWEIPGDEVALVRLEVVNDTTPADYTNVVEKFSHVHIGQRRTGDVQNFQNDHDPAGVADATASNGDRLNVTPTPGWVDATTHAVIGEGDVQDNVGRFRILARLYDAKASGDPTLEARLAYWVGQSGAGVKYLTGVVQPQRVTWNMVNLTPNAAQIADAKFRSNFPGALSYTLQLRRPSGTGDARLDYVLQLPTDGGFLEAEITPGLEKGVALVADNTASSAIGAQGIRVGYVERTQLSDHQPRDFCSYKGDLYLGTSRFMGGITGGIWKKEGTTWTKVYTADSTFVAICEYNGQLHALELTNAGSVNLLGSVDGITWTLATAFPAKVTNAMTLFAFNGLLWAGVVDNGTPAGLIYSWDGNTLTEEFSIPNSGVSVHAPYAMGIYQNKLYVGAGNSTTNPTAIYEYTPGGAWVLKTTVVGESVSYGLVVFGGKLYIGTLPKGKIVSFDGSAWTEVLDSSSLGANISVVDLIVRDDRLYAARMNNTTNNGAILYSTDGNIWHNIYDTGPIADLKTFHLHEGDIYLGCIPTAIARSVIFIITPDVSYQYSVANYQLGGGQNGGFTAPNRRLMNDSRRHRWVVSFDRSDGSNVISDKAMIGIGYVSRFLSLIGEG